MSEIPQSTVKLSLTSEDYPGIVNIVDVTIDGQKQVCDQVYQLLAEKFNIVNHGGEKDDE